MTALLTHATLTTGAVVHHARGLNYHQVPSVADRYEA